MTYDISVDDDLDATEALVPMGTVLAFDLATVQAQAMRATPRPLAPPARLDCERAILGGILLDGTVLADAVAEGLEPEHFARPAHATIFRAALNLRETEGPVDVLTVVDELDRTGQLDAVGGAAAVSQLEAMLPTTAHVGAYSRIVVELAARRKVIDFAQALAARAYGHETATSIVRFAEEQLPAIATQGRAAFGFAADVARARADLEAEDKPATAAGRLEPLFEATSALMDADIPTTAWLIEGLLTQGAIAAISGEAKTTKTWAGIDMLIAIATGTKVFGEFWTGHPRPVAAFLTEDGRRSLRNRLKSFCAARGIDHGEATSRMHHRCMKKLDLRRIEDAALLLASLRALPEMPSVLLLDPLRNLIGNANEDKANEMAPVLETLRAVRNLTGCTILFVHHSTKSNETSKGRRGGQKMRGSGAIHGAIDCGLYLDNLKGDATHRWLNTATVDVKDAEGAGCFGLELNVRDENKAAIHAEFTFWRDPKSMYADDAEAAPTTKSTTDRALVELRREHEAALTTERDPRGISVREMGERLNVAKSTAGDALKQLANMKPARAYGSHDGFYFIDTGSP